jgi:hypothetical protein
MSTQTAVTASAEAAISTLSISQQIAEFVANLTPAAASSA